MQGDMLSGLRVSWLIKFEYKFHLLKEANFLPCSIFIFKIIYYKLKSEEIITEGISNANSRNGVSTR